LTLKQIEIALKVKIDLVIPDMPKQMIETQVISEPAITQSSVLRALMVSLAREAGFSGGRDEVGEQDAPKPSVGFFKKLLAQK
jgi:pilus assembly protein CpaE